ncbi:hypothetical protein TUM20983_11900 [Mycobacterium antarcticum]|nr:hypothetical protein TUM20983_11900 [Mycolicibacterium sp. TUM20983]
MRRGSRPADDHMRSTVGPMDRPPREAPASTTGRSPIWKSGTPGGAHRTFESWAADLAVLAGYFEARVFAVTGWSEGGPWALAAAAYLEPARLVHVACIAGVNYGTFGANWAAEHLNGAYALGGRLALHFHAGFRLTYEVVGMSAKHFGSATRRRSRKPSAPRIETCWPTRGCSTHSWRRAKSASGRAQMDWCSMPRCSTPHGLST